MISQTLESLNLGIIREITFKPATNKKNESGNSIVVHFDRWFRNPTSDKVRQKLISGESIKINYTPKAYLQVIAFQPKNKPAAEERPKIFKKPTITFDDEEENDFGPKLGPNCSEKYNTPKVKVAERPRPRPRDERPKPERKERPERPERTERPERKERPKRPTTPECPPPTTEPKPVVYHYHNTTPDAFDMNSEIASRGVLLPPPKLKREVRKINFHDTTSDSEDELDNVSQDLYGDLNK